ncbi:uncharacterized protein [Ambystoma mexicanum]|uniref:uncharacterized protein n=1 Tax=Ambystoma mexicanum TaxID=8296 RepID=UPI0037E8854F
MPNINNFKQEALLILTVDHLKDMCKVRSLLVKGKKNKLIEKLLNHQRLGGRATTPIPPANVDNVDEDDNVSESGSDVIDEIEVSEESQEERPSLPQPALGPQPIATGTLPGPVLSPECVSLEKLRLELEFKRLQMQTESTHQELKRRELEFNHALEIKKLSLENGSHPESSKSSSPKKPCMPKEAASMYEDYHSGVEEDSDEQMARPYSTPHY